MWPVSVSDIYELVHIVLGRFVVGGAGCMTCYYYAKVLQGWHVPASEDDKALPQVYGHVVVLSGGYRYSILWVPDL